MDDMRRIVDVARDRLRTTAATDARSLAAFDGERALLALAHLVSIVPAAPGQVFSRLLDYR
jgi:hypothetical protein